MTVVVVATLTPKPEEVAAVRETLFSVIPQVHAEPGCLAYALHEADGQFVLVEKWESVEALDAHRTTPATAELGAGLKGRMAAPPVVTRLTPVPAGTASQGTL